ncbi:MAG: DUF4215 domain-containing protein, partial [Myxococcota bacterium]|nr:DUF4215 domain-containing protein [Myxococcota bacterium]
MLTRLPRLLFFFGVVAALAVSLASCASSPETGSVFRFDAGVAKTGEDASVPLPTGDGPPVTFVSDVQTPDASAPDACDDGCAPAMPVCGNGVLESGEQCDDGNSRP